MKTILHAVHIHAEPMKVYEALTTAEGLSKWWTTNVTIESYVGGVIHFTFQDDFNPQMQQTVLESPRLVRWTCNDGHANWQDNTFVFTLEERQGETLLQFKQEYAQELSDEIYGTYNFNWGYYLKSLKQLCETGTGTPFEPDEKQSARESDEEQPSMDAILELQKLEYTNAANRFENIYRAIWTIFSYLTAVAAALLAFGATRIQPSALIALACFPLIFWFWTTYVPLDRYGSQTADRLKELEEQINNRYSAELSLFTSFAHPLSLWGGWCKEGLYKTVRRARFAIWMFFIALHLIFVCQMYSAWNSPMFLTASQAGTSSSSPLFVREVTP